MQHDDLNNLTLSKLTEALFRLLAGDKQWYETETKFMVLYEGQVFWWDK